jgi:hypothetical protein
MMQGAMELGKDANSEVVTEKCANSGELKDITKKAGLTRREENCLAKGTVRRMRKCRANGEDGCCCPS